MTDYGVEWTRRRWLIEQIFNKDSGWVTRFFWQSSISRHSLRFIGSVGVVSRGVRGDEGFFWVRWIRVPTFLGPVSPTSQLWQIAVDDASRRTHQETRAYWSIWKWIMKQFRLLVFLGLPHPPEILQPHGDREFRLSFPQPSTPFVSSPLSFRKKFFVSWDRAPS